MDLDSTTEFLKAEGVHKKVCEVLKQNETAAWLGKDVKVQIVETNPKELLGKLIIPKDYFPKVFNLTETEIKLLIPYLLGRTEILPGQHLGPNTFSFRSVFTQLTGPLMLYSYKIEEFEDHYEYPIYLTFQSGKPVTNYPESFNLGRFFVLDKTQALPADSEQVQRFLRINSKLGISLVDGFAAFIKIPIDKILKIGARGIDLVKALSFKANQRSEMDKEFLITETQISLIRQGEYILAESSEPIQVPEDTVLIISLEQSDDELRNIGFHLESIIIDPGFFNKVRYELFSFIMPKYILTMLYPYKPLQE